MKTFLAGSVLAVLAVATGAAAQVGVGVDVSAHGSATSSAVQGGADAGMKVQHVDGGTVKGERPDSAPPTPSPTKSNTEAQGNAVSAAAVEIRGWDTMQKQEFLATVKTQAQLRSGQDLENFAKGILLKDENVQEISSDDDSVEVRYRVPAKFLGVFETTLPVDVVAAKAKGDLGAGVKVHFPWFKFLFGVKDEVSQLSLENSVRAAVIADLDRDGRLDIAVTARLYTAISNILKTKHDAAVKASASVK